MSKNMTRKGLAFGAGLAMAFSSLAVGPANAAITVGGDGKTPLISVKPTSGPENALAVIAADGASFSVTASPATSVMGGGALKYKVTDPNGKFLPGSNTTGGDSDTIADSTTDLNTVDYTDDVVSLDVDGVANGSYLMWAETAITLEKTDGTGDKTVVPADTLIDAFVHSDVLMFKSTVALAASDALVKVVDTNSTDTGAVKLHFVKGGSATFKTQAVANDEATDLTSADVSTGTLDLVTSGIDDGTYLGFFTAALVTDAGNLAVGTHAAAGALLQVTVSSNSANFATAVNISGDADGDAGTVDGATTLVLVSNLAGSMRAADNSYVVSTGVTSTGVTGALELVAVDDETRSVSVTAFVDAFADGLIGGTEFASEGTTLSFVNMADVTATTVLTPPKLGDDKLTAKVTTSPLINIAQNGNADLVEVVFTRQDSVTKAISDGATQDADTGVIEAEIALLVAADQFDTWVDSNSDGTGTNSNDDAGEWESVAGTIMPSPSDATTVVEASSKIVSEVVTVTTDSPHGLRVGDIIDLNGVTGDNATALNAATGHKVASIPSTSTFTFALEDATDIATFGGTVTFDVITYTTGTGDALVDRVFPGDYSAQAAIEESTAQQYTLLGSADARGNTAAVAADVIFSTTASASVQGKVLKSDDASEKILVKSGTASVDVTLTVVDKDGAAVGAGRPVVTTLSSRTAAVTVNALKVGQSDLLTDANGQVKLTVASSTALDGDAVTIKAVAEGVTTADSQIVVEWDKQAFSLYDLNTTQGALASDNRYIAKGSSYTLNLLMADQWYQPAPSDTYRIKVSGSGVTEGFVSLVDGRATVVVTDVLGEEFQSSLGIQKATAGVFATSSTVTITNKIISAAAAKVTLGADGSSLYASATADLADAVAKKALVERDNRLAFVAQPAYANDVVITGKVTSASSGASLTDAVVTISGPTNVLFSDGEVDKRGSITVVASNSGEFSVKLYSTTAQKDTVITVTSVGVSATTKVTFTGIGVGEGTSLVVTAPAAVKPASTFQVKAKLSDVYGNGVDTAAGRVKVTYTGPGIVFGTLPTETDANGELMFSVLLGSNDTGNVVVTVSYDQNGDADYVDAKDLNTTSTTAITATGVAAGDKKVNAGSFKGYVALYARGYEGQRMSAKVGADWVVVPSIVNNQENGTLFRAVEFTGAGVNITVRIYIDRVLVATIPLVTK